MTRHKPQDARSGLATARVGTDATQGGAGRNTGAQALTVRLPYPPTTNNAYLVANRRLVKTPAARDYEAAVTAALLENPNVRAFRRSLPDGARFTVVIQVHPPDRRRRDLANVEKLAVDSVFKHLGADDCRIDRLMLFRGEVDRPHGHLVMSVQTIQEEEQ